MEKYIKTVDKIDIYFEALEEDIPLKGLFPDDTEEQLRDIEENNVIFCAKVIAKVNGIELACDYLGGCVYENEEDFYTKCESEYFSDMINTVVKESKEVIQGLVSTVL